MVCLAWIDMTRRTDGVQISRQVCPAVLMLGFSRPKGKGVARKIIRRQTVRDLSWMRGVPMSDGVASPIRFDHEAEKHNLNSPVMPFCSDLLCWVGYDHQGRGKAPRMTRYAQYCCCASGKTASASQRLEIHAVQAQRDTHVQPDALATLAGGPA